MNSNSSVMSVCKTFLMFTLLISSHVSFAQKRSARVQVYFPFNSSIPNQVDLVELKKALESFDSDSLFITAHCDSIGSNQYNDALSEQRKLAVIKWLTENNSINLQTIHIHAQAQGKRIPLNQNRTEAERQLNRRVDISWTIHEPVAPVIVEKIPVRDSTRQNINTKPDLQAEIENSRLTGKSLVLKNINFVGGRDEFLREAYPTLKELLQVMKSQSELKIEIQGHVCCTYDGQDGPNIVTGNPHLSVDRAKAVYDYLVYNGIDPNRMRYKGFGGSKRLIYPEMTESDRTTNRRVEIVVLRD